ncbi:hypothetical protein SOVF_210770 [Spinacia oleracea]|nr:hypothetical protein SOVF_210770 [Spinacia oleracea]
MSWILDIMSRDSCKRSSTISKLEYLKITFMIAMFRIMIKNKLMKSELKDAS